MVSALLTTMVILTMATALAVPLTAAPANTNATAAMPSGVTPRLDRIEDSLRGSARGSLGKPRITDAEPAADESARYGGDPIRCQRATSPRGVQTPHGRTTLRAPAPEMAPVIPSGGTADEDWGYAHPVGPPEGGHEHGDRECWGRMPNTEDGEWARLSPSDGTQPDWELWTRTPRPEGAGRDCATQHTGDGGREPPPVIGKDTETSTPPGGGLKALWERMRHRATLQMSTRGSMDGEASPHRPAPEWTSWVCQLDQGGRSDDLRGLASAARRYSEWPRKMAEAHEVAAAATEAAVEWGASTPGRGDPPSPTTAPT